MIGPAPRPPHASLPRPLSSFVGREGAVVEVASLLTGGAVRLVTLLGPGGVGKTRLAIEAASTVGDHFPDGAHFVDLAPLTDPALVIPTIARTLGLQESGEVPISTRLARFLCERRVLLVIDNLEQVIAAAAEVAQLLGACPDLVVLATSREPLAVGGEQRYPVAPLETGPGAEAVRLFAERARAAAPTFVLMDELASVVSEICRRLDGLPLAVELAAARITTLPPADLLARLDHRLSLLTSSRRDVPERQRTMRDVIAWSYDLLPAQEQALFRQLATFVGGFTLEAAAVVAGDPSLDVLAGVASLIDKSLVRQVTDETGAARYAMLETVREFGLEQLDALGEAEPVRAAHAAWVAGFAEVAGDLLGPISVDALARLATEHDNARAALRWAIDAGAAATGLRIATLYFKLWLVRGFYGEGRRWLEEVLEFGQPAPVEHRAVALCELGWLAQIQGDPHVAESAFNDALALAQVAPVGVAEGDALAGLGIGAMYRGEFAIGEAKHHEALALARGRGDDFHIVGLLCNLGVIAADRGDLTEASRYFEESLRLHREGEDPWGLAIVLSNVGWLARKRGDLHRAAGLDRERLAISIRMGNLDQQADCCQGAAEVARRLGHPDRAARLAGVAARVRAELGVTGDPMYAREVGATEVAIRAALAEDAFDRAWADGRLLPLDAALVEADAVFAEEEATPATGSAPSTDPAAPMGLTSREVEVLRFLARDRSNQQIADALFLSRRTVHKHVENVLAKLGVDSRAGAAVWAVRHGLDGPRTLDAPAPFSNP